MVLSAVQIATRAFVKILLAFAAQHQVSVTISRDSSEKDILGTYRRVVKKVHPDKGGKKEDHQKLQDAKVDWEAAVATARKRGRPTQAHAKKDDAATHVGLEVVEKGSYEVHARGVMLTYHGLRDQAHWLEFKSLFEANVRKWNVLANLEYEHEVL